MLPKAVTSPQEQEGETEMKLNDVIKVISFPVWINEDGLCEEYMDFEDFRKNTTARMRMSEVCYITTDGSSELTIEI